MTDGPDASPGRWQRIASLILGDDVVQRRWVQMVLITALLYCACVLLLAYGVWFNLFARADVAPVAALVVLTPILFFVLIRCGLNRHFAEPSLAFPQALCAQTNVALAYGAVGPVHPATLIFLSMVLVFGMFDMGRRRVRLVMLYTLCVMGAVMAWSAYRNPLHYPPVLELLYFLMMCTTLPAIGALSEQLATMRDRLRTQRAELKSALAQIQKVAAYDELTGLPNRRHLLTVLDEHITRRARGGPRFAVALADIDHFKNVNDTYGHGVGDDALAAFAAHARAQLRITDIVGRWGGEEFLLVLPETSPMGDPNTGVERLRSALAQAEVSAQAPGLRLAFSAGLTRYIDGEAIDAMIERADRALYKAKNQGRNVTVVH